MMPSLSRKAVSSNSIVAIQEEMRNKENHIIIYLLGPAMGGEQELNYSQRKKEID